MTLTLYCFIDFLAIFFLFLAERKKKIYDINIHSDAKSFITIPVYKIFIIISFFILFFFVAFRDISVGSDYTNYVSLYLRVANGTILAHDLNWVGFVFIQVCKVFAYIFGNFYLFLFQLIGFISLLFLYKTIWKESKIPWLSLFLFISFCLYYQLFNQLRQMMAILICFSSYSYLKKRSFWKYVLTVGIAALFHKSAIIMLPFYFIATLKINKRNLCLYIFGGLVIVFGMDYFLKLLENTYIGSTYLNSIYNVSYTTGSIMTLAFRFLLSVGCLLFSRKTLESDSSSKYLYNLILACTVFQIAAVKIYFFSRLTTYFFIFYILLIPLVIHANFKNHRKLMIGLVLFLFIVYHFIYYFSSSGASGCGYEIYNFINIL